MSDLAAVKIVVRGRVQGVFFRDFTTRRARELGLTGYVRNVTEGAVEAIAEGERVKLEDLARHMRKGPPGASVASVDTDWSEYTGAHSTFGTRF
ncbi:MAG: acylphosphatase [Dehalococcoidales bacterium]